MSHILDDLRQFLDGAPTSWHAAVQIANRLATQDFIPLEEKEPWKLESGKKYFVVRGGSFCAFSLPDKAPKKARILAAHTDSPGLKLKPRPEIVQDNMTLLGVEVYGSPLLATWINRDLGLAGRVVVRTSKGEIEENLLFIDDAPLCIPSLAIHLDREMNEKGIVLNKQEHLAPLAGLNEGKGYLEALLHRHLAFDTLLGFDLFAVPLETSRFLGGRGEMLASSRIDNLLSVHACASALARTHSGVPSGELLQMVIFWDHEEIGSASMEGAESPFLGDILQRIGLAYNLSPEDLLLLKNHSLCISVDMAHATSPYHPEKTDPQHKVLLGEGIALKHNADLRYGTSAQTGAVIRHACNTLHLKIQDYVARSDRRSGSTIGPIAAKSLGIPVVDIGIPQLSMHAAREVASCQDYLDMVSLLAFLLQEKE